MYCSNCWREIPDNSIKCPYCDSEISGDFMDENSSEREVDFQKQNIADKVEKIKDQTWEKKEAEDNIGSVKKEKLHDYDNNSSGYKVKILGKIKRILFFIAIIFILLLIIVGPFSISGLGTIRDSILELAFYYISVFWVVVFPLLLISNFKGIRNKLPLYKRHRIGSTLVASIITYFLICIVLVISIGLVENAHTDQYRKEQNELRAQQKQTEEAEVSDKKEAEKIVEDEVIDDKDTVKNEISENTGKKASEQGTLEQETGEQETGGQETGEQGTGEQETEEQEALDIENYSSYPYLSKEYLTYSLAQMEINFPLYPQEVVVQNYLDNCDNMDYQNVDILGILSSYYSIVDEQTEYIYFGETKNGKPDGLGVIKERIINLSDDPQTADIRYYDGFSDGAECFATVYAGYFQDGKYNGFGMLYKTPIDEEYINNGIYLDEFYQNIEGLDIEKNIAKTINPVVYIGEFSNGKYGAEGYEFYYTALNNATNSDELDKMKKNAIVVYPYIKDKESDLIFPEGDMPTFEITDVTNYTYREHLHLLY